MSQHRATKRLLTIALAATLVGGWAFAQAPAQEQPVARSAKILS